ncbi:nucleotide sugar dehydrogenase / UDP-N-acetyl-D-galactosamine 6-dehydrogenase [Haloferax elongans ATCC BAA-1513]|uniref:UDP-N-acetyl-D-mannosamine dehydrogenase n=1 Tax=Haloferax elongans ATCC BAA-1513 TaxID=1230453 RepID=M0I243_HALEO|nr:nucleotide sugar dehydrogenase [Haloferax elongans]ELZ89464.1 nucleotide sugar dehydrogenase / UDP-N-acetyl-D-galactosamine 6-dehydrogenase [Haloferax elongans ATCC BAA-1513]
MTETVCIVGLGYVGLPLAIEFDRVGKSVIGYDVDQSKVDALDAGTDPTGDVTDEGVSESDVLFTTDPAHISDADFVIVTVPTPVDSMENPDLQFVESAGETIGEYISPGTTVVLESTVYPGATESVLVPALESTSPFTVGEDIFVGYSPERASPGDTGRGVRDVVKVVGANTDDVREDLATLYESVVDAGIHRAPDIETAEASKVIENVQRDMNIALVNELAIACDHMDLSTSDVLEAAGTKWNFHDGYSPGFVGGHCIPVDPFYLTYRSKREGFSPKLVLQAREINEYVPVHAARKTVKTINDSGRVLNETRLLVLGLAYKPGVGDIRSSEVDTMVQKLQEFDIDCVGYDPHADPAESREVFGIDVVETVDFEAYDGVVVATGHEEFVDYDLGEMADALGTDPVMIDVADVFDGENATNYGFQYAQL